MVYQVGRPWMLEGNRFFPEMGMPILKKARRRVRLAVCEPEPLEVAMVMEKLLMIFSGGIFYLKRVDDQ
jgi:hypothetical protein